MNVFDIMTHKPVTIRPENTLREALETLETVGCHHLPVLSKARHLIGILSDRDCRTALNSPYIVRENWQDEALQTLRFTDRLPSLIVSDIVMQEMDGRTLWNVLQSEPTWRSIPFLFITGAYQIPEIATALNSSQEHFLLKPFTAEELLFMTKHLLLQVQVG